MTREAQTDRDVTTPCDHEGCGRESTHSLGIQEPWGYRLFYYCPSHAPDGATTFAEDDGDAAGFWDEEEDSDV